MISPRRLGALWPHRYTFNKIVLAMALWPACAQAFEPDMAVDPSIEEVHTFRQIGTALWIGADGLFRWDAFPEGKPRPVNGDFGRVWSIEGRDTQILVAADNGLFQMDSLSSSKARRLPFEIGVVHALLTTGSTLWIGSDDGLFKWEQFPKGKPEELDLRRYGLFKVGILTLSITGNSLWIGERTGLVRWEWLSNEKPREVLDKTTWTLVIADRTLWAGTSSGVFASPLSSSDKLSTVPPDPQLAIATTDDVVSLRSEKKGLFVGTLDGLFLWQRNSNGIWSQSRKLLNSATWALFESGDIQIGRASCRERV